MSEAVPVENAFPRVTHTSSMRNATTPEWITGAVDALISVMSAWHSAVVSDFCGKTSRRCAALERLRTAQRELRMRMSENDVTYEQARSQEQEQRAFVDAYANAARQCQQALRDTAANPSESEMMANVTEGLRRVLDQYRATASSTTRKYVDRGVYTVVAMLDYARWSVTEASRAAKQARELLEDARRHGYQEAEQLVGSCAGRCIAMRQRWEAAHARVVKVFEDMQRFSNTDALAQLTTKTETAARALDMVDAKDGRMCLSSTQFFSAQALALRNALKQEAAALAATAEGHHDDKTRRANIEDAIERTNANILNLSRALAENDAAMALMDENALLDKATERIAEQTKLEEATTHRAKLQKQHAEAAQREYYSAALNRDRERVASVTQELDKLLVELEGIMDEADDFLRQCGEKDSAYSNVDESLGHHIGEYMCAIATHAEQRFEEARTGLQQAFQRDTQALARAVESNMGKYKNQAWRELAALKQLVNSGASVGLLSAGNAIREEHKQHMILENLEFGTRSAALQKPLQISNQLAQDLLLRDTAEPRSEPSAVAMEPRSEPSAVATEQ